MKLLYNTGILLYTSAIRLASMFNPKASQWVRGRKGWKARLDEKMRPGEKKIWIHCASLGEFEQGRPLIEEIKSKLPEYKVFLTFFSPSGYEVRKNYAVADWVEYLPADLAGNARHFVKVVDPELVIFIKYEFWNNYINELHRKRIPLYLVSGIFRPGQHFFRWYGFFFRNMLRKFKRIFVQDALSEELLAGIGITSVTRAGDTRFDRVVKIAGTASAIPQIEMFRGDEKLFLAGSSWKADEEIIARYINRSPSSMKWVFAPHEIEKSNIERLERMFDTSVIKFSEFTPDNADARVMIIDNIGMLSSAYRYAYIAAVGGGFGKGIHNILEPACWKIPVVFGPNHTRFREAVELIKAEGAMTFNSYDSFEKIVDKLISDDLFYLKSAGSAANYITKNTGATAIILREIF
jgi:3-deoxy-D-manno-octulosonic-acid transferase